MAAGDGDRESTVWHLAFIMDIYDHENESAEILIIIQSRILLCVLFCDTVALWPVKSTKKYTLKIVGLF